MRARRSSTTAPGERGGVECGSATVFRKRGGAAAFGRGEERLVPPPEGEGEGARLTTSAPPGARPATSAPPLYPPLPSSSEASPLPTPYDDGQNELQGKKACDVLQSVLQSLQDMSLQFQHMSIVANPPHQDNEASSLKCLAGPPAWITPARWSGVIRDAILDGQWNVATRMGGTQALACPVVQVNGQSKWEPHDWKFLQQARSTIAQYGVKSEGTRQIVTWIYSADLMCPHDCRSLMRLLLTPTQFLLWGAAWAQQAMDEAM